MGDRPRMWQAFSESLGADQRLNPGSKSPEPCPGQIYIFLKVEKQLRRSWRAKSIDIQLDIHLPLSHWKANDLFYQ